MTAYFILALLPFAVFLVCFKDKHGRGLYALAAFFLFLILLMALRHYSVGIDLLGKDQEYYVGGYKYYFDTLAKTSWDKIYEVLYGIEKGYVWLNKAVSVFVDDFRFFLFIVAILSLIPLFILYAHESENTILSIALFLSVAPFTMYFSGLRQILAMAFVVPAYYCCKKRWLIPFLLVTGCATLFHDSAFVLIFLYPIMRIRIPRKAWPILTVLMAVVFLFRQELFIKVIELLSGRYGQSYGEVVLTGDYTMLFLFVIFTVYAYVLPCERHTQGFDTPLLLAIDDYSGRLLEERKLSREGEGLRNLLWAIMLILIFTSVSAVIMRVAYYFLLLIPIAIPKIAYARKKKYDLLAKLSIVVMIVFFFAYFLYSGATGADVLRVFPYIPFWGATP